MTFAKAGGRCNNFGIWKSQRRWDNCSLSGGCGEASMPSIARHGLLLDYGINISCYRRGCEAEFSPLLCC